MNSSAQVAGRAIKCFSVLCTSQSEECFALLDSCFFCLHYVFKVKFLISLFPLKFFFNFLSLHTHFQYIQYIVIIVISVSLSQTLLLLLTPFSPTSLLYTYVSSLLLCVGLIHIATASVSLLLQWKYFSGSKPRYVAIAGLKLCTQFSDLQSRSRRHLKILHTGQ